MAVAVDPVKQKEKFMADLEAMRPKGPDGTPLKTVEQRRLISKDFGLVQFKHNRWSADLTEQQTIEDAVNPVFWANVADIIMGADKAAPKGRGDIIEVRKLDASLYAELLIIEIGKGYVKTLLVRGAEPPEVVVPEESPLIPKWNVGRRAFDVVRKGDSEVMSQGHQTKHAAVEWINKHRAVMAN